MVFFTELAITLLVTSQNGRAKGDIAIGFDTLSDHDVPKLL